MDNIGNIRADRIRELMKREHITQTELAEKIGTSQQRLSANLKKGSISEQRCRDIYKLFPEYDLEWLLGLSEHPNIKYEFVAALQKSEEENVVMLSALFGLARLSGFQISQNKPCPEDNDAIHALRNCHAGVTISRDGRKVSLSLSELSALEYKLCDYVEFELSHMMK